MELVGRVRIREEFRFREEFHCVGNSESLGVRHVTLVVSVMVDSSVDKVPGSAAVLPRAAFHATEVDRHLAACGDNGGFVVVKVAIELSVGRDSRVDSRLSDQVECQDSEGDNKIPTVGRKRGVEAAAGSNKVSFICLDSSFSRILAVVSRGDKLVVELIFLNGSHHQVGDFVVHFEKFGNETLLEELIVAGVERCDQCTGFPILDGESHDVIGVVVIENEKILVAAGRFNGVASRKIHGNQVAEVSGSIDAVNADVVMFGLGLRPGGLDILFDEFLVTVAGVDLFSAVGANPVGSKARPSKVETFVNGLNP